MYDTHTYGNFSQCLYSHKFTLGLCKENLLLVVVEKVHTEIQDGVNVLCERVDILEQSGQEKTG